MATIKTVTYCAEHGGSGPNCERCLKRQEPPKPAPHVTDRMALRAGLKAIQALADELLLNMHLSSEDVGTYLHDIRNELDMCDKLLSQEYGTVEVEP